MSSQSIFKGVYRLRPLQLLKTLFRTPFKTFLTFLLLSAVTFVFVSRIGEYSITNNEIKKSAKEYRGIGSAEIAPASDTYPGSPSYIHEDSRLAQNDSNYLYQPLSQEQISSLLKLPYISSLSTRYMTPGVSDKYFRLDEGGDYYNYTARFIIEGTLSGVEYGKTYAGGDFNDLTLEGCTLLSENPPLSVENKKVIIHASANKVEQGAGTELRTTISNTTASRTTAMYDDSYMYDTAYIKNLTIGDHYVFVGRYEPLSDSIQLYLSDNLTNRWCEAIQSVEVQPENYLKTEKFTALNELIELTNSDLHTFDVVYTDDMSAITRFAQGNMTITNGRKLTKEDSDKGANVCVVSSDFASSNKLVLGDKITLKLGTQLFEQYKGLGAVAATRERYSRPDKAEELEIVGIYIDTDSKRNQLNKPNWGYSINTVFVPKSLLPLDESMLENHMFSPSEFNFTVDNAWDIPSFVENIKNITPQLEKIGIKIIFNDDGWPDIVEKYKMSTKLSIIAIVTLSVAVIVSTWLIVYLFIGRKKKEYAILRALGTTKKESIKALILPLMLVTISAVFVGSCAAWIYTTETISKNSTILKITENLANTSIPITVAVGCIMSEVLLVLVFALYRIWRISTIPPLMLLQDNQIKQTHSKKQALRKKQVHSNKQVYSKIAKQSKKRMQVNNNGCATNAPIYNTIDPHDLNTTILNDAQVNQNIRKNRHSGFFVLRYIAKHIRRSVGKSILSILLSALLFGAVGQFQAMHQSYINLCNSTDINATFINGLSLSAVTNIMKTGYAIDPYYEYTHYADFNYSKVDWVVTNDIASYTDEKINITYAQGYDESYMKEFGNVCVVGENLLKENGLVLGDKVHVTVSGTLKNLQSTYINKYKNAHPDNVLLDNEILELSNDEIKNELLHQGSDYTIVGTVTTPSDKYEEMVFSPGVLNSTPIFGQEIALDLAEFTLANNLHAYEFRSYVEGMDGINTGALSSNHLTFNMDTSKIDNLLKALSLFEKLLPVVLMVAVVIEGLVCGLIILHSSKEVAILRILGTSRRKICILLMFEQLFHCIVGLILGALGVFLYNDTSAISGILVELYLIATMFFVGCFVGSFVCSIITTNRKVLDLLQAKE